MSVCLCEGVRHCVRLCVRLFVFVSSVCVRKFERERARACVHACMRVCASECVCLSLLTFSCACGRRKHVSDGIVSAIDVKDWIYAAAKIL